MDFTQFLNERNWTELEGSSPTSYTRPLYGSESLLHQTHKLENGMGEVIHGVTLNTEFDADTLQQKLVEALARIRFESPILAATIKDGIFAEDLPSWVYSPAPDAQAALAWAKDTLEIVEEPYQSDDFILTINKRRLPYTRSDGVQQHFRGFFLKSVDGKPSFAIHGTHAIFDAHPTCNLFHLVLQDIASEHEQGSIEKLAWGSEWKNLPPGAIIATGGAKPNFDTEGLALLGYMQKTAGSETPTLGLKAARTSVSNASKNLRVREVIDAERTSLFLRRAKEQGFTITQLFEAANAVTIFQYNPDVDKSTDIHVTMEGSYISLLKYMVPPYNKRSHIAGAMAMVPIKHPGSIVRDHTEVKDQLVAAMHALKATYNVYTTNSHIAAITSVVGQMYPLRAVPMPKNPTETVIVNVGVIERLMAAKYPEGAPTPTVTLDDMYFGHRLEGQQKLIVHFWTINGQINLMTQSSDIWDADYLRAFLRKIVENASAIL